MKDHISNYSLQYFIPSNPLARLIVVTGKGGVGKTSFSIALTKVLNEKGFKAVYNNFDQAINTDLINKVGVEHFQLELIESARLYIAKKLGSEIVATWILKTPFFKALFNMLPGLNQMILLGHLVNMLEEDPELTIVMDSPSSGHALTMFEASHNFREIFSAGKIVEDIDRLHNFIYKPGALKTILLTLPTEMSLQESIELDQSLKERNIHDNQVVLNDCYGLNEEVLNTKETLPDFLKTKIELEERVFNSSKDRLSFVLSHHPSISAYDVIENMIKELTKNGVSDD
ncbi:ArsA-related P-loop ATPase [Bacteriovoracaceae bacterium]|nr:ArsA-related P-loop ATPase [Bacteriovoracaceae bacterium]